MKKILFAIGFLLISTAELAAQSLSEIINQKETILVDVRTPEEFAQGNVKNSINIPISELENNLSKLEGKKNVVVFCKAGIRAAKAEKQNNQQQSQQRQQETNREMSKESAERLLNLAQQAEKQTRGKLQRSEQPRQKHLKKNW